MVHCKYLGVSCYIFKKILSFLSEDLLTLTNSEDLDEMPHCAAFHLGLHLSVKVPI